MMKRYRTSLLALLVLMFLAFVAPYWLVLALLIVCAFAFKGFWGGLLVGLLMDIYYGTGHSGGFPFMFVSISCAILILVSLLKGRLSLADRFEF